MNRRTLLFTLAILLLAAASQWLSRETKQEARQAEAASGAPDSFIADFSATELGVDGRPARRLEGAHLSHFADQRAVITEPHLTVYRPGEAPWEMTAAEGRSMGQQDLVRLTGGVRIYRSGAEPTEVVTDNLDVQPKRRYAETAAPVTITNPQGRVDAVGMQAFLEEERMVLRSHVRGTYEVR
jgi:lipopolysaccharide export system protein LptC